MSRGRAYAWLFVISGGYDVTAALHSCRHSPLSSFLHKTETASIGTSTADFAKPHFRRHRRHDVNAPKIISNTFRSSAASTGVVLTAAPCTIASYSARYSSVYASSYLCARRTGVSNGPGCYRQGHLRGCGGSSQRRQRTCGHSHGAPHGGCTPRSSRRSDVSRERWP